MTTTAVIVDFHADEALTDCLASLVANGVSNIVIVENGAVGSTAPALADFKVTVVQPGVNLGYGRGVNRGVAASSPGDYLVISNPDVVLHDGAVAALVAALDADPRAAIAGPRILRPDGTIYPSHRVFPNMYLAGLHALLAPWWPSNPATRRYRSRRRDGGVDWVSGACFVMRREAFEEIGGFDESYFMFAEDMALCWSAHQRGWGVIAVDDAVVTHVEGLSRRHATRSMIWAHHRSAFRFEAQTSSGLRRLFLPVAAVVLGARMLFVLALDRRKNQS